MYRLVRLPVPQNRAQACKVENLLTKWGRKLNADVVGTFADARSGRMVVVFRLRSQIFGLPAGAMGPEPLDDAWGTE